MKQRKEIAVGGGTLVVESGHLAKQANGSCVVRLGDTVVLTTACMAVSAMPRDFLPLTVDYREYTYAAGRIPGGFFKREGRPTEKETITSRLIDRPLRPLFPTGYTNETQVIALVLSADGEHDPDILAINGASFALVLSNIPFYHPVGAVRVGLIDGEVIFNPTNSQRDVSDLDLVVVGTEEAVAMVEAGANQLSEEVLLDCIFKGHQEIQKIIRAQIEMFHERGLEKPSWTAPAPYPAELYQEIRGALHARYKAALNTKGKFERKKAVTEVQQSYLATVPEDQPERKTFAKRIFETLEEEILREVVLDERIRFDGRRLDEVRPIAIEVGLLPRTHGSALFTRGETQALASITLGTKRDAQVLEEYEGETLQKFMLHYNFPPFSVGEVKFMRSPGRREIGHGVLARRALLPVLPHGEEFPYTVRVVSDILESNGSSSMATVCGGSLALFDAAVPMLAPVAGVAMGLIKEGDRFAVLTDIAGQEDHYGDMDFKVCGTGEGITALQMDIKVAGVNAVVLKEALEQARKARLHILEHMATTLPEPRENLSKYAPRIVTIKIPVDKIREVIGPGGKMIRSIVERTGCKIDVSDDGTVNIASTDGEAGDLAKSIIEGLTATAVIGKTYLGTVQRLTDFGAFVEILPNQDGLLHISEIADYHVKDVHDELKEGQQLLVKCINVDGTGRIRLSRKALLLEGNEGGGEGGGEPREPREPRPERAEAAAADGGGGRGEGEEGGSDEDRKRRRRRRRPGGGDRG